MIDMRKVKLLKVGEWTKAPQGALKTVKHLDEEYGGNIAVGHHEELGWIVLHDQGNGVEIVWKDIC